MSMSEENNQNEAFSSGSAETNDVDLDSFSAELFGRENAQPETTNSEEEESENTEVIDADESDEDTQETTDEEDDTLDTENEESEEDEEEGDNEPAPKPKKKNRFQERIDEIVKEREEARRELAEIRAELENLKKPSEEQKKDSKPEPTAEVSGPSPDDTNEDGSEKYPLGEFDPSYIRDLTRHVLKQEQMEREKEKEARQAEEAEQVALQKAQEEWSNKLAPAAERYPDFMEKGQELITDLESKISPEYSAYLSNVIMEMDYGPDVLYYLANNPDEAMSIVSSGAKKATGALYRLEAKFVDADLEKKTARPKVSKAPAPPSHMNKGSASVKTKVPADTDDLSAFENEFFQKRKRK